MCAIGGQRWPEEGEACLSGRSEQDDSSTGSQFQASAGHSGALQAVAASAEPLCGTTRAASEGVWAEVTRTEEQEGGTSEGGSGDVAEGQAVQQMARPCS